MTSRDAGEDLLRTLDELDELISNTRSMPMNTSMVVDRENAPHLIDWARSVIPGVVRRAERIVTDADAVLTEGWAELERLARYVQEESEQLVARENTVRMINDRADSIMAAAEDKAASLRHGADKHFDRILAFLEVEVVRVAEQIHTGREVLAGHLGDGTGQPVEIQEPACRRSGWFVDPSAR